MQALLDAWVVGGSPSRPQSTGAGARRPTNERAPTGTPRGEMIRPADADKRAPPTWLERLSESTLVKDTWLDRNLVKPLSENASVGSSISSDISGSRTARAAPGAAEGVRSGEREARRGGREGHAQERPASAASPYDHRSGAMTDRYGGFGDRRGAAAPERGGRDLVEHLRELESSLARPAARDREYGRSSASESWRTADRHRETVPERDGQRQRAGERGGRPALEASALSSSAVLASRLASPRDVRHSDTLAYREVVASPRGPPTQHEAKSLSRAGLLASPRVPKGYGGNILASREGGALLGYNKYNDDSDESSSDSEPEQPSIDEIDVSTLSFVSNGERVWRAPDGVFSKRNSCHPDETEQDAGKRNSEGADSTDSRRSSAGPHIPTLNFGDIVKEQRDPHRPSSARESSRPNTPSVGGSPVMKENPPVPLPSSMHSIRNDTGRTQAHGGRGMATSRDFSSSQQAMMKMYESLKADYDALKAHHKSTSEQNDNLRVSIMALERTLGNMRAEKDSAITSGGRPSSNGGSLGGWLTSRAVDSPDSKCPSCSSSKHDLEAVRLELARERTRRRALEQEKEKLEAMLIQASRTGGSSGGGMLIDLGEIASPRGLLMKDTSRGSRVGTPRGDVGSPMGPHSSAYRQGLGGDLTPRGQTRGGSPMSSPRGTKQHDLTPRGLSSWT